MGRQALWWLLAAFGYGMYAIGVWVGGIPRATWQGYVVGVALALAASFLSSFLSSLLSTRIDRR